MFLVFVHHQKSDLIVVFLPGKDIFLLHSPAVGPEDVGPKVCTWLLKGKSRPPQVCNDYFLQVGFVGKLKDMFSKMVLW
jgi:hypothetical protein